MTLSWRSLLFVPLNAPRLLEKAHLRAADAIILDLEDAVPAAAKAAARARLPEEAARLAGLGVSVVVRVNTAWLDLIEDLPVAVHPAVRAVMVPKVEDAGHLRAVSAMMSELEARRGLPDGQTGLLALVETPAGLGEIVALAAISRVRGLALGSEDYAASLGVPPSPAALALPCQMLVLAARARGLMALAVAGSLADFKDLAAYGSNVAAARAMGATGALCVHPAQVGVANAAFGLTAAELAWAEKVVAVWAEAERSGAGVGKLDGHMIDKPVVDRARKVLAFHDVGPVIEASN